MKRSLKIYTYKITRSLCLLTFLLPTTLCFAATSTLADAFRQLAHERASQFDGRWEGNISSLELEGDYPDTPFDTDLLIVITGNSVALAGWHNNQWYKMPYEFTWVKEGAQAILYTTAEDEAWSEAYTFLLTLDNNQTLNVLWSRSVNNYALPETNKEARGYFHGQSKFKRSSR